MSWKKLKCYVCFQGFPFQQNSKTMESNKFLQTNVVQKSIHKHSKNNIHISILPQGHTYKIHDFSSKDRMHNPNINISVKIHESIKYHASKTCHVSHMQ